MDAARREGADQSVDIARREGADFGDAPALGQGRTEVAHISVLGETWHGCLGSLGEHLPIMHG